MKKAKVELSTFYRVVIQYIERIGKKPPDRMMKIEKYFHEAGCTFFPELCFHSKKEARDYIVHFLNEENEKLKYKCLSARLMIDSWVLILIKNNKLIDKLNKIK